MDKNQAMIDFLVTCPTIMKNPLFFNFAQAKNNNNQLVIMSNDSALTSPYVDGTVLRNYRYVLLTYKSVSYIPVVKESGYPDENLSDLAEFQEIIDWIKEQEDIHNYPDFGETNIIDSMETLTDNPALDGVDISVTPAVARYSVTIQIKYLDISKKLWK